uniref:Uncharacterized protein n=1 Tax=Cacopsylla melanoneura TaxID=428564 RepID=A0A8D8PXN9_9HEMI
MDGGESLSQNNDIRCSRCPPEKAKLYKGKKGLRIHYGHAHRDFLSDLNCDRTSASETFVAHLFDSVPSTSSVFVQTDLDLLSKNLTNLKKNVKIIKRIPKGVRMLVASQLCQRILLRRGRNCFSSLLNFSNFQLVRVEGLTVFRLNISKTWSHCLLMNMILLTKTKFY